LEQWLERTPRVCLLPSTHWGSGTLPMSRFLDTGVFGPRREAFVHPHSHKAFSTLHPLPRAAKVFEDVETQSQGVQGITYNIRGSG
jgi:hypothetical protein